MNKINKLLLISFTLLFILLSVQISAQENNEEQVLKSTSHGSWETHAGLGVFLGVNGLPSQISNALAIKEGFLKNVSNARGLPIGASVFAGAGYRINNSSHSIGLELGIGFHQDGGSAQVTLGDDPKNIPGYVFDALIGTIGTAEASVLFSGVQSVYPGLITINTMKGYYLDPKLRVYHRYRKVNWSIQSGIGLGLVIPTNYFAYPSKIKEDFILRDDISEAGFNQGWKLAFGQGPMTTTRIPFPLVMRDGTVMMRAIQPLADFNIRAGYRNYFLDLGYSTEFRYIHHVKIGLGVQFI